MSVLVSGSCGFIGSHLVQRLLIDRYDVIGVDDLRSSPLSLPDLKAEFGSLWDRQIFYQESIQFYACRGQATNKLQAIFHLAAPVGPAGILPYTGKIVQEIVSSTYAVIELALIHQCRLILVSSSETYGGGVDGLCREDMPRIVKINEPSARLEYSIGKLAAEIVVLNTPGLESVIVQPFNVTGVRQSDKGGFILPRFVKQALAGEPLTVFGDGQQQRAFTDVADICDGLVRAWHNGRSGQTYNLGNDANRMSVFALAKQVIDQVYNGTDGHMHLIQFTDGKTIYGPGYAEANNKFPDVTKARDELGWVPIRSVAETVADVIAYEKNRMSLWMPKQKTSSGKS